MPLLVWVLLILILASGLRMTLQGGTNAFDKASVLPLRGLLVLLVVVGHSLSLIGLPKYSFATPAVAVFFFISGYGLMQKRLLANGNPLYGGFRHAVVKLLPAFLIASSIYSVWIVLRGESISLLHNIVIGSSSLPIPFTWYIPAIFALYGIFYFSDRICRSNGKMLVCATLGVMGYWVLTAIIFKWPFYWWRSAGGFVAGFLFATIEARLLGVIKDSPGMVYLCAAVLFIGISGLRCVDCFPVRFAADHVFLAILGPLVVLVMYCFRLPKMFGVLGGVSYEMYIVHGAFVHALSSINTDEVVGKGLYVVTIIACAIVAGSVLNKVVRWLQSLKVSRLS